MTLQSFGKMLSNPLYMGRVVVPKWGLDHPGDFEALVSPELFESVQAVINGRRPTKESRSLDHPDFPLRRVVRCGRCGTPLTASWSRGRNARYPYYHCRKRHCGGTNVRKEVLERLFVSHLQTLNVRPEVFNLLNAVVEDAWKERLRESSGARSRFEAHMKNVEVKRDRLVDAYLDQRIDQATYEHQLARLGNDEAQIRAQLDAAQVPELDLTRTLAFASKLLEDLPGCWNRLNWRHKQPFLYSLFPEGLNYEDGTIGTTGTPWLLAQIGAGSSGDDDLAAPTGFEPVSPP